MRIAGAVVAAAMTVTLGVYPAYASGLTKVTAAVETAPNWDDEAGGDANADDPAIWVDHQHPERSVVLGALKNGGLTVFDLTGQEVQRFPHGLFAVHDGENPPGDGDREGTDFKLVRLGKLP